MGTKGFTSYKILDQNAVYFLTLTTVGWIDVFTRKENKSVLISSLQYCQNEKGLILFAWVIMSNHVHLIAQAKEGYRLSDILRDFKKYTSKALVKALQRETESRREWIMPLLRDFASINPKNKEYQLWRNDNHPIQLDTEFIGDQKIDYIHNNPVEAGLVDIPEHYLYSSAQDYHSNRKGMLEVQIWR